MADAWFLVLYKTVAEPLAEADPALLDLENLAQLDDVHHPLWSLSVALQGGKHAVPKVFLNPGGFEDLWSLYQVMTSLEERVSKTTLGRVYNEKCKKLLPFP